MICLCPDKKTVLQQAYNVLKVCLKIDCITITEQKGALWIMFISHYCLIQEGGELYFSDMYASSVVPDHMKQDAVLWGKISNH